MKLEGNKVYLRPMTKEDTDNIVNWRNKDFVRNNFIDRALFTHEGHLNWIKTMVDTKKVVQFIIVKKDDDKDIGSVYLRDIDYDAKTAEYGIFIGDEAALNKGFGSESAKLILKCAKEELKLNKVFLRLYKDNEKALNSYKNAGFKIIENKTDIKNDKCVIFMEIDL